MDSRQLILELFSPVRGDALTVWVGWLFVTQRVCVVWLDAIKTSPLCLKPSEEDYMRRREPDGVWSDSLKEEMEVRL